MKLFNRKDKAGEVEQSPIVECRSWYGVSFHLRDTRQEGGLALCGYAPLDDRSPVTAEEVERALPLQHEGWKYCGKCVSAFLEK